MSKITLAMHMSQMAQVVKTKTEESNEPKMGLNALFPNVEYDTEAVGISVTKKGRSVAVDVKRCTDSTHNTFSDEKSDIYKPPYFSESFNFTQCQRYDVTFAQGQIPTKVDAQRMAQDAVSNLKTIKDKILRAIEKQRSQVLQSGIVTLVNGDSIDFKREADSMKVLSGAAKWDAPTTSDPISAIREGGNFLRKHGAIGGTITAIFGSMALENFLNSTKVKDSADVRRIDRISISNPIFNDVTGMAFHGQVSVGDFNVDIWTYSDFYEEKDGANWISKDYIDSNNVILVPKNFKAETAFCTTPAVFKVEGGEAEFVAPIKGEFNVRNYVDQRNKAWWFEVNSAPLAIPVNVDLLYTIKTA